MVLKWQGILRRQKFENLRRAIIQKAIEELVDLWDKCLIHQYERDEFFEFTKIYELLLQEVSRLQELCKGIRPTSFFQSSFQLLEEENEENLVGPI
ncbi:hypothetical protein Glove_168g36 [Diversispora epigaea]|uniref:Uncharacterized protein n=1 Tax=Diversispora epigaea TaxID=1348612 RepID=A0A397IY42_9GLOM|nr:hypothetical protein Glove_168g36 [Diversispora epigaea]